MAPSFPAWLRVLLAHYTTAPTHTHTQQRQVLKQPEFNKYAHMQPPINILTIFEYDNQAALAQLALDFLADGAIVISKIGNVVASGVTVLDLKKGSVNGWKKTAAASSAAQGDGTDAATFGIAAKLSEDDCQTALVKGGGQKVSLFSGALPDGAKKGGKEGYAVAIRDPNAPAVTDDEFLRLAQAGHVAGVEAFTTAPENKGRVDAPRHVSVSGVVVVVVGCGGVDQGVVLFLCSSDGVLVCDGGEGGGGGGECGVVPVAVGVRECVRHDWSWCSDQVVESCGVS